MQLQWVELDCFRNLGKQRVELHPRYNLLVGDNGQGKTNFLEAISFLGTLKSFRSSTRREMIRQGSETCRTSGRVLSRGTYHDMSFALTGNGRTQYLDGQSIRSPEDYLAALRVSSFIPEDVGLVSGTPSWRRKVVDRSVFETKPQYVAEYRRYLSALRQRNALLRQGRFSNEEIESWNRALAATGSVLARRRWDLLLKVNRVLTETGRSLGLTGSLALGYAASFLEKGHVTYERMMEMKPGEILDALLSALESAAARERKAGHTITGPHRDNIIFTFDGDDMGKFASQGQKRTAVLALKLALASIVNRETGNFPLILLDDVASELDVTRRKSLGQLISKMDAQFFVTTTSEEPSFLNRKEGFVFKVENGGLERLI